jgi:hypothetical protein
MGQPEPGKPADVQVSEDTLSLRPASYDGAADANFHRARVTQQRESRAVLDANVERAADELLTDSLLASQYAQKVANVLPQDLSPQERRDSGAVAIYLHDPRMQLISRYRAADALLIELRKSSHADGWYLPESSLRILADKLAGVAHVARLKVWTGQHPVMLGEYNRASLGLLSVREDV